MNYLIFYIAAPVLNIPFGFFRKPLSHKTNNRKLRFLIMMLLIHAPIPLVILMRYALHIDRTLASIALSIFLCVLGQLFGGRVLPKLIPYRLNP